MLEGLHCGTDGPTVSRSSSDLFLRSTLLARATSLSKPWLISSCHLTGSSPGHARRTATGQGLSSEEGWPGGPILRSSGSAMGTGEGVCRDPEALELAERGREVGTGGEVRLLGAQ